ncbi:MAG: hypothetical protein WC665_04415 [Sulfurimonas sp.]|jgi:hypothetical protein
MEVGIIKWYHTLVFQVHVRLHKIKNKREKMANCPHCKKEIDVDTIDNVMGSLADGNKKVTFTCKSSSCKKTITAINEANNYYIKAISGDDEFIGAK